MDYRRLYDSSDMLYAYDLEDAAGRDVVLQIEKVWGGELTGEKGRKSKKPFVKFVGKEKKLALNKTNGKAIAKMYGKDISAWPGQWVALFVTTTEMDGETRDCIRIRPNRPAVKSSAKNGKGKPEPAGPSVSEETRPEISAEEAAEIARIEAEEASQS